MGVDVKVSITLSCRLSSFSCSIVSFFAMIAEISASNNCVMPTTHLAFRLPDEEADRQTDRHTYIIFGRDFEQLHAFFKAPLTFIELILVIFVCPTTAVMLRCVGPWAAASRCNAILSLPQRGPSAARRCVQTARIGIRR